MTIRGYTPSSSDVGKHLVIGMPLGIRGSTSTAGAGGSSFAGETLRVLIASVHGQTIDFGSPVGSSPTTCQNAVTDAECDIGTDNAPLIQTFLDNQPAGASVCVPPGNYFMDSAVEVAQNVTIYCQSGAIFYEARNDHWTSTNFPQAAAMFYFDTLTGGGVNGCTAVSTNTGITYNKPTSQGINNLPDVARFWFLNNSTNMTFQNIVDLNNWGDSDFVMFSSNDTGGSNNNIVRNTFSQGGFAYGPAVIAGANNTFSNNVMRDACYDIEPNNSVEASMSHHNVFDRFYCWNSGSGFYGSAPDQGATLSWGGGGGFGFCGDSSVCNSTQSITNGKRVCAPGMCQRRHYKRRLGEHEHTQLQCHWQPDLRMRGRVLTQRVKTTSDPRACVPKPCRRGPPGPLAQTAFTRFRPPHVLEQIPLRRTCLT